MSWRDDVAEAAMESLTRHGVPIFRSDMPGLFCGPTVPELTFNQLLSLCCERDPAFDPARVRPSFAPGTHRTDVNSLRISGAR